MGTMNRVRAASGHKQRFIPGIGRVSTVEPMLSSVGGPTDAKRYASNKMDAEGAQIRKNLA